ncbi:hypothetical protein BGZ82_000348 [Podila clonocystis]|nr:hypothetical protein BGZ82_000348 [Podila clonocystis]
MSAANVPEGLKNITPFLQRAAQLQERDQVVSYYANYYAAKLAIAKASKDNRAFIDELLNVLEKQRKDIGDNEAISNDLVGYAHIENFAIKIFSKADDEDHEGQSSQKTAKNFVAAANFLELLKVFGDIDAEIEEKIKYAKWRAADIIKAIRDGRQPTPPPGGNKPKQSPAELSTGEFQDNANMLSPTFDASAHPTAASTFPPAQPSTIGAASTFPTISNFPSPPLGSANINMGGSNNWNAPQQPPPSNLNMAPQNHNQNQNFYNPAGSPPPSTFSPSISAAPVNNINNSLLGSGYLPPSTPSTTVPSTFTQPNPMAPPSSQPTDPAVNTQVQKHCKWTVSALTYDDIPTAVDNLEKALALLRPYLNKQ